MKIHNKLLIFGLMLILVFSLTGCGSDGGGSSDDLVWNDFSNEYVSFKYPAEWEQGLNDKFDSNGDSITDEFIVQFMHSTTETGVEVDLTLTQEGKPSEAPLFSSKQGFYDYVEKLINDAPSDVNFEVKQKITFNGYPAYKVIDTFIDDKGITKKEYVLLVYKNTFIQEVYYSAEKVNYNQGLAEEFIDSVEFNY